MGAELLVLRGLGLQRGPMLGIAGAGHEVFLAKDLFHLCHLGAVRGFAVNVLCYLATMAHFDPGLL